MCNFQAFTSDISTAFLQGRPHGPERTLWVRFTKKCSTAFRHGHKQTTSDEAAARSWYIEAVSRIMGISGVKQHPLDACLFMIYDDPVANQLDEDQPGALVRLFSIHVDDLLGGGTLWLQD